MLDGCIVYRLLLVLTQRDVLYKNYGFYFLVMLTFLYRGVRVTRVEGRNQLRTNKIVLKVRVGCV